MAKLKELSIFFPFFNEEANVERAIRKSYQTCKRLGLNKFEVIGVNDGSQDQTGQILEELKREFPSLIIVHHRKNQGYGAALKSGFQKARLEWIFFTDGDLQFDLNEIDGLIDKADQADLVIGYYLKRAVSWHRKLNSFLWQILQRLLFGLQVKDIDCGFKLIKKKVIDDLWPLESNGAMISAELLIKVQRKGYRIAEVGVHHYADLAGGTTGDSLRVIRKALRETFSLWRKLR